MKTFILAALLFFVGIAQAQFTGPYYIGAPGTKPGGGDPQYATLKAANDAINAGTVVGDVTFYITSDLTEPANSSLGVNTNGHSITYKPADDLATKTITFTQTTDNTGPSGGFVIGASNINDWATLVTTDSVIIDGYADGGSTKRLTWKSGAAANYVTGPLCIAGNSNKIYIKNCTIIHEAVGSLGANNVYGIAIRVRNASSVNYVPDNIVIDNNDITITTVTAGNGVGVTNSGTPTVTATGVIIKNNSITARHRGIFVSYAASFEASNNVVRVNQTTSGYASMAIGGNAGNTGTHTICNNKILQVATANILGGANGIRAIQASGGGSYNIYNNFITGFSTPSTGTTEVVGIRVGLVSNIYNNTIVLDNVGTTGGGTTPTAGIVTYVTTCDIRNNIIVTNEDDIPSYCIYASSMPATSDYNLLYRSGTTNAKIGYATSAQATLDDWKTASAKDANSKSVAVTFQGATDLRLGAGSDGNTNLIGTPLAMVTTDIEGAPRNSTYPYMGADEGTIPLPVELTSFTASAQGSRVVLSWATATETNNFGFDVEKLSNGTWNKIGFVEGAGTSASPKSYQYVDASCAGKISYRLKQIDRDGKFTYSNAVEVTGTLRPEGFELSQNYPNPFNPATTIRFAVKQSERATLKVYDVTGREVIELFNDMAEAGQFYTVNFNAAHLSSGMYIYVLQTPSHREVKKMQLLK